MPKSSTAVVVLNWNDADLLPKSVGSLLRQTEKCDIIVVDNASSDNSREVIESFGDKITALWNTKNKGFAGGVNAGIRYALNQGYTHIALLNNDAVADNNWIKALTSGFRGEKIGGVTCSFIHEDKNYYDSTGEMLTIWGLPYPRGRGEKIAGQYDDNVLVSSVSGGASMFSSDFLKDVGLFDEDFFAYYEDIDIGLRGQLRGWNFKFIPKAIAYHATGTTSGRVKGFTTYQTIKNLPWLLVKNIPVRLTVNILPRFFIAYWSFVLSAVFRGDIIPVIKGLFVTSIYLPKKLMQRIHIQRGRKITSRKFGKLLVYDLPPNADKLRKLRKLYWKVVVRNNHD